MDTPITKYAKSGNMNLAYQIIGNDGEYLILIPGWISNIEEVWNIPEAAAWLRYLASLSKLVIFDKRGTGLSDTINENNLPDIEQRSNDLHIILSSIGVKRANFLGLSEGGPLAIYLAAHYPELVNKLILIGSFSKWIKTDDYPFGLTKKQHDKSKDYIFDHWGEAVGLKFFAPSVQHIAAVQNQWAKFLRRSASPKTARMFYEMNMEIDVRGFLDKVNAPTLIMHRRDDTLVEYTHSEYMHSKIPNSQFILTEGEDHLAWFNIDRNELTAIQTFLEDGRTIDNPKIGFPMAEDIFVLYRMKDYILTNFQNNISIKYLSKKFGINEYKIKSGFKLLFDTPVIGFLTQVRLSKACEFLTRPYETVSSVSEQVGYKHSNNFSVAFKRKYKLTPLQYRAKFIKSSSQPSLG